MQPALTRSKNLPSVFKSTEHPLAYCTSPSNIMKMENDASRLVLGNPHFQSTRYHLKSTRPKQLESLPSPALKRRNHVSVRSMDHEEARNKLRHSLKINTKRLKNDTNLTSGTQSVTNKDMPPQPLNLDLTKLDPKNQTIKSDEKSQFRQSQKDASPA